ncbi:MAG: sigma-70 family RNA polymerase sigma factor [Phycisphaera sp.]|nr:sigma-70 family RNA polymerase sigma factor [Phycisphaera sp.]
MALPHDQIVRVLMRHRVQLLAFIRAIVSDVHLAEDILQDVSALAIQKSDAIDGEDHLLPWVRQAARYKAMNALAKRSRQPRAFGDKTLDLIEADWAAHDTAASNDTLDALEQCVERLSPYSRSILDARYKQGHVGDQLAEAVKRKTASVYVQLSRIHNALADCVRRRLAGEVADV